MTNLIEVGAAGSDTHGCHIPEDEPGLSRLKDLGYVHPMGSVGEDYEGWYTLTNKLRGLIQTGVVAQGPAPILNYCRPNKDLNDRTCLELIALLTRAGWVDRCASSSRTKSVKPFAHGSEKLWFRTVRGQIHRLYLTTLLRADEILQRQDAIDHFQPANYYRALLAGCSNVLSNQPLAYYKQIMGHHRTGKQGKTVKGKKHIELEHQQQHESFLEVDLDPCIPMDRRNSCFEL